VPLRGPGDELAFDVCFLIAGEAGANIGELVEWMHAMLERGVLVDDHAAVGIAVFNLAEQRTCEGRYLEASRLLAEAVTQFERRDPFGYLPMAHGMLVGIAYHRGDAAAAKLAMERYRAALGDSRIATMQEPYHARVEATALLAAGDAPAAQRVYVEAAERCEEMPHFGIELRHHALRSGAPAQTLVDAVSRLRVRCDARLTAAYADHITACAADDGAALMRVTDEFADVGMIRYAVESAAHAAEAFAADGHDNSAGRALARCRELHALGEGGWLPPTRGVDAATVLLTPRERQLVELAARGLTNAEIADRLALSVRTVESHIYRAMQKLGVDDRRALGNHAW
jgi:DNA-binding CsgD family transcriptional regulator